MSDKHDRQRLEAGRELRAQMRKPEFSDLATFLWTRLDEDEAAAKACHYADWEAGSDGDVVPVRPEGNSYVAVGPWGGGMDDADVRHIARHDPARVLREVAAARMLLAEYEQNAGGASDDAEYAHGYADAIRDGLLLAVKLRAAAYSDHPDYREEWAP